MSHQQSTINNQPPAPSPARRPLSRRRHELKRPAQRLDPIAHRLQAETAPRFSPRPIGFQVAHPIVDDFKGDALIGACQRNRNPLRLRVRGGVIERLLHDAIQRVPRFERKVLIEIGREGTARVEVLARSEAVDQRWV